MNHSPALDLEKLSNRMLKAESYEMIDIMRQDIDSGLQAMQYDESIGKYNNIFIDKDWFLKNLRVLFLLLKWLKVQIFQGMVLLNQNL